MSIPVHTEAEWLATAGGRRRFELPMPSPAAMARLAEVSGLPLLGLTAAHAVAEIVRRVRDLGDAEVRRLTAAFDNVELEALEVPRERIAAAGSELSASERNAIELAAERIRAFHALQVPRPLVTPELELRPEPLRRVGIYVPGGRARYPSTVLMNAIPARLAGVGEVVMVTPPGAGGQVSAAVLFAAQLAGVDRVFAIGGAQAIAALAHGTETVPAVDKITGPGNVFVTLAKREVFGVVDIDGLAGPTEIMVIADASAAPRQVVVDLAAQLEHDPLAEAILVTDSPVLAETVAKALADDEPANRVARASGVGLRAAVVLVADIARGVSLAARYAPEHLQLMVTDVAEHLPQVRAAGTVFAGECSPVAMGDYIAGTNHTLPTGGAARYASPLGVYDFYRWSAIVNLSASTAGATAPSAALLAALEGLPAHQRSLEELVSRTAGR